MATIRAMLDPVPWGLIDGWGPKPRTLSLLVLTAAVTFGAVVQSFAASVTLAWNPSTGPGIAGYRLYHGAASRSYTNLVDVGNVTNATLSSLVAGTTYYFSVTAYDSIGLESEYSTEVTYTPTALTAPTIALTSPASGASYTAPATVGFSANVVSNGQAIAKVQFYNGSSLVAEDSAPPYSYSWTGVAAGTYSLKATAIYGTGSSVTSAPVTVSVAQTIVPPSVALTAPANNSTFTAPASFTLAASVSDNGNTISKLQFFSGSTLLGEDLTAPYAQPVTNLNAGSYSFTARAVYGSGNNVASSPVAVTVASPPPVTNTGVTLAWNPTPGAGIAGYYLYYGIASRTYTNQIEVGNATNATVPGLVVGRTYYFAVTAYDAIGLESDYSSEVVYTPGAALAPSIALTSPASGASYTAPATVVCSANVVSNGQAIAKVQFYNGSSLVAEDSAPPYSYSWTGVAAGTYSLKATAIYGAGSSVTSAPVTMSVTQAIVPPSVVLTAPADNSTFTAPAAFNLAASVTPNGNAISKLQFYNGSSLLGEDLTAPYDQPVTNLGAGSYSFTARAVFGAGSNVTSWPVTVTVSSSTITNNSVLPPPWQRAEVGGGGIAGTALVSDGVYSVSGSGSFGGTADQFTFVCQPLTSKGEIRAQLRGQSAGTASIAGVMLRETLLPGSRYAFIGSKNGATTAQSRSLTSTAATAKAGTPASLPLWVRLLRSGSTIYYYTGTDGVNWVLVDSTKFSMASTIYVGFAVGSGNSTALNSTTFGGVTVVP